jgi:hypothetical protein
MIVPRRLIGAVVAAATAASLAIPAVAGARAGDLTFVETYPRASRLCASVAAGKHKHLQRFAAQVQADCAVLQNGFTAAQSAVLAERAVLTTALGADRAALALACPPALASRPACENTRDVEHRALVALRRQRIHAARRYYKAIEAGRDVFWRAIHALPGEGRVRADAPIEVQDS